VCRFFTDAYDLYMVGVITPMIAFARFPDHVKGGNFGSLPDQYDLVVKGMALVGTLMGQVRPLGLRAMLYGCLGVWGGCGRSNWLYAGTLVFVLA
jgi:PHS family inorganic phosphate transporter-like MFS transporter